MAVSDAVSVVFAAEITVDGGSDFKRRLWKALAALLVCTIFVVLCYMFVDRPVAEWVYEQRLAHLPGLKSLTYPPPLLQSWTPVLLVLLMVRRAWKPFNHGQWTLVAACVSMILADQCRETLAYAFGRTWPETWIDNNPSFIRDGAFGFHPLHGGVAFASFPSGHTARTLAVAGVAWIAYRSWRWACVLASIAVAVALIGMNYHFVSDVIAGGFVGGIVAMYVAHFCGLRDRATMTAEGMRQKSEA
jgi:membrane-associated phospholipid phosphatase